MTSPSTLLDNAVDQLATLPGIGRRTAMRLALDLLRRDVSAVQRFADAIRTMRENVRYCETCCNISEHELCGICASQKRDHGLVCVVEDIRDVVAIENTHQYTGAYHVLGGVISPMDGIGPEDLRIGRLLERAESGDVKEVILALSATLEGDTTCFYLNKRLQERGMEVSMIARGISVGGDIEHVDEVTLGRSILDRKPYDSVVRK